MKQVHIVPTGGLCNRMRAMASGIFLAQRCHLPTVVYWNNAQGLKADFADLFQPISLPSVSVVENKKWLFNVLDTKSYLLRLPFLGLKGKIFYNFSSQVQGDIFPHLHSHSRRNLMLISCFTMCEHYPLRELFVPQPDIFEKIRQNRSSFADNTIGVHIRRTDNYESIRRSPLNLFIERLEQELRNDSATKFYLATDSEEVKTELKRRFAGHVITSDKKADRESLDGMKAAVVELFCLSQTRKIIGSDFSSYSQLAAEIGGIGLEYARL